jgi:hypothetical protein
MQNLEVMADRRLGDADRFDQVAGGTSFSHAGDDAQQAKTGRIAEDAKPFGQLLGLILVEGFFGERRTALRDAWHGPMIPHIDGHRYNAAVLIAGDVANCPSGKEVKMAEKLTAYSHGSG